MMALPEYANLILCRVAHSEHGANLHFGGFICKYHSSKLKKCRKKVRYKKLCFPNSIPSQPHLMVKWLLKPFKLVSFLPLEIKMFIA